MISTWNYTKNDKYNSDLLRQMMNEKNIDQRQMYTLLKKHLKRTKVKDGKTR